jgi:hypothetical protein
MSTVTSEPTPAACGSTPRLAGAENIREGYDLRAFERPDGRLNPNGDARVKATTTLLKLGDLALTKIAGVLFEGLQLLVRNNPRPSFTPRWSEKPVLKSWEKSKPPLGWPRETDSLCPKCVKEARERILAGDQDYKSLITEKVGEIRAQIIERDGQVWMIKDCPQHGHFEDLMAVDSKFLSWIETNFPGRDIRAHNDEKLHNHGTSTIRLRAWQRAHRRPDQPLQHDVRSLLHGRQSGGIRP